MRPGGGGRTFGRSRLQRGHGDLGGATRIWGDRGGGRVAKRSARSYHMADFRRDALARSLPSSGRGRRNRVCDGRHVPGVRGKRHPIGAVAITAFAAHSLGGTRGWLDGRDFVRRGSTRMPSVVRLVWFGAPAVSSNFGQAVKVGPRPLPSPVPGSFGPAFKVSDAAGDAGSGLRSATTNLTTPPGCRTAPGMAHRFARAAPVRGKYAFVPAF